MRTRPAQFFFWKTGTNSTADVWPNHGWTPIFSQFGSCLTTSRRLRRSLGRANSDRPSDLQSLCDVVKRLTNWLKIGVQPRFGQTSTVDIEAEIPKKFGLAYWSSMKYALMDSTGKRIPPGRKAKQKLQMAMITLNKH